MQIINLLINNYIILSLIDSRLSSNETTKIYKSFTQDYWFYKDIVSQKEVKALIVENIINLKKSSQLDLKKKFLSNTNILNSKIPINQKFLHIKTLDELADIDGLHVNEKSLVKEFSNLFEKSIVNEYPMSDISFDNFKKYIVTLIKYTHVDEIAEYEKMFLLQEIEMYIRLNNILENEELIYADLLNVAVGNDDNKTEVPFSQKARDLFILFNPNQDKYFKKVIIELRNADNKQSLQERTLDSLFVVSEKNANKKEIKIESMLNDIINTIPSFKITPLQHKVFVSKVDEVSESDNKINKLHISFINMENILCLAFNLEVINDDKLLKLFKAKKLDFQRQLFLNKLLYVKNIDNKHIIDDDLYEKFIKHIASVCFNYYYDIPLTTIEDKAEKYPVFDFRNLN